MLPRGGPPRRAGGGATRTRRRARSARRRLEDEDRAPVEELRQDAAERGPDRGAERAGGRPDRDAAGGRAGERREERERAGEQQRGADPLEAAEDDQRRQAPRRRRADEPAKKSEQARRGSPGPTSTRPTNGTSANAVTRDDEVVRRDHPRDADDARVERAVDVGQREHDDRRVRERHRDRRRDRARPARASGEPFIFHRGVLDMSPRSMSGGQSPGTALGDRPARGAAPRLVSSCDPPPRAAFPGRVPRGHGRGQSPDMARRDSGPRSGRTRPARG